MIEPDSCLCDRDTRLRNHRTSSSLRDEISMKSGMTVAKNIFSNVFSIVSVAGEHREEPSRQRRANLRRKNRLPERLDDWGECSSYDEEGDDEQVTEFIDHNDRPVGNGRTSLSRNGEEHEIWAATVRDISHTNLQLLDSILESAYFMLTEHLCLVHLTPEVNDMNLSALECQVPSNENVAEKNIVGNSVINSHAICRSIQMHREVAVSMGEFANCTHDAAQELTWPCPYCECTFYRARVEIKSHNVVLSRFLAEMTRYGPCNCELMRDASRDLKMRSVSVSILRKDIPMRSTTIFLKRQRTIADAMDGLMCTASKLIK